MDIFIYNIKRMYKKKYSIIFTMLLPVVIFLISTHISKFGILTAKIAVIDNDKTEVTNKISEDLKKSYGSEKVDKDDIFDALKTRKVKCVIVIDNGFTSEVIKGKQPKVKIYCDKDSNLYNSIEYYINSYLKNINELVVKSKGSNNEFKMELKKCSLKTRYADASEISNEGERNIRLACDFLIMFMLFSSISFADIIFVDKEKIKESRIFFSPVTIKNYMFQCILNLFVLEICEVLCLFIAMVVIYSKVIIPYIWVMFLILFVFSITTVSMGMFVNYVTSKYKNLDVVIYMVVVPMCMLGGCFWDISDMPVSLRYIGYFVPTTWVTKSIYAVFFDKSNFNTIALDLLIMSLFSVVFFLMGMLTKKDIVD